VISAHECAALCAELYDHPVPEAWDRLWSGGEVICAVRRLAGTCVLIFRGSVTTLDWMRDLQALPKWDPEVGFCHGGFLEQIDTALAEAIPALTAGSPPLPVTVTGHSLGAARARIAAAKLAARGLNVEQLCTFGSPRPGFANVRRVIEKSGMAHRSFRNGHDPVCLVPFPILPVLPFEHTEDWTAFWEHADGDDLRPERDHAIGLYVAGTAKLSPP